MAAKILVLRSVSRPRRCAYCHDGLGAGVACAGCGVRMHQGCWRALGRCPSLGCAGLARPRERRARFSWGSALPLILLSALALAPLPAFVLGKSFGGGLPAEVAAPPYEPEPAWRPEPELLSFRDAALELLRTHPEGTLGPEELLELPEEIARYAPQVVVVGKDRVEVYLAHGVVTVGPNREDRRGISDDDLPAGELVPRLWWERRR